MSRRAVLVLGIRRVLVDTSAYYALADQDEPYHRTALLLAEGLARRQARLFTTNFVMAEIHALLVNRLNRDLASTFVKAIYAGATTIVRVSKRDEERAWHVIDQYDDKAFSLTDATSFAVMDRLRIDAAFTFDADFAQYGLSVLTPEQVQG